MNSTHAKYFRNVCMVIKKNRVAFNHHNFNAHIRTPMVNTISLISHSHIVLSPLPFLVHSPSTPSTHKKYYQKFCFIQMTYLLYMYRHQMVIKYLGKAGWFWGLDIQILNNPVIYCKMIITCFFLPKICIIKSSMYENQIYAFIRPSFAHTKKIQHL